MVRKIIHIDEEKCNGCGICEAACHEGAIEVIHGKAKLVRENFCDGLGDCLPTCPMGAITFEEREAPEYDEEAVERAKQRKRQEDGQQLSNWPVQIKLAPVRAPYFHQAQLLIAADCTAYAYAAFHQEFARGRVVLIGCPKLDGVNYSEKLAQILSDNDIQDVLMVRMEVPCCGGLELAVKKSLENSGKSLPCQVVTISTDGKILN